MFYIITLMSDVELALNRKQSSFWEIEKTTKIIS
jgi:hypothetical protein